MLKNLKEFHLRDTDERSPKYERLRNHIVECLQSGQLSPGDPLPPEQKIVEVLGIARSTVRQALATLEREGLVRRVHGKGSFIEENARQKLQRGADLLALVVPEVGRGFYPSLQSGFEKSASQSGSQIIVADTRNSADCQANIILQLMDKNVGGLAVVPPTLESVAASQFRVLQKQGIPVVFCHRKVEGVTAPLITFDAAKAGRLAGQHLVEKNNHRQVAFVASHRGEFAEESEAALRGILEKNGSELPESLVFYGEWTVSTFDFQKHAHRVEQALRDMLDSGSPPTAIYCSFDTEAELVYLTLNRLGLSVPKDISVVGFGGSQRDRPLLRQLTSITVNEEGIGDKAAAFLHEMRSGKRDIENNEVVSMPLAISAGHTLAKRRRK